MQYRDLVAVFEELAAADARTQKTRRLAELLADVETEQLGPVLLLTRGRLFEPWEAGELGVSSALTREAVARATGVAEDDIEATWRETGDLGTAAARAVAAAAQQTFSSRPLTVTRVYEVLRGLAEHEGRGSRDRRVADLAGLIADAEPVEAKYLVRTAGGAMRLGVGDGIIRDAIVAALLDDGSATVKRAIEVTNDVGLVAKIARTDGVAGLAELDVTPFRPIKPMLAQRGEDVATAMADLGDPDGRVLLEAKYDGIRAKLHGEGDRRRLYTRRLADVTAQFPDVMEAFSAAIDADAFIIEAELVGIDHDRDEPVPFQELSRRIQREHDVERLAARIPVYLSTARESRRERRA